MTDSCAQQEQHGQAPWRRSSDPASFLISACASMHSPGWRGKKRRGQDAKPQEGRQWDVIGQNTNQVPDSLSWAPGCKNYFPFPNCTFLSDKQKALVVPKLHDLPRARKKGILGNITLAPKGLDDSANVTSTETSTHTIKCCIDSSTLHWPVAVLTPDSFLSDYETDALFSFYIGHLQTNDGTLLPKLKIFPLECTAYKICRKHLKTLWHSSNTNMRLNHSRN